MAMGMNHNPQPDRNPKPVKQDEPVWRTQDGRLIPVSQMSEKHAKNALIMLMKQREEMLMLRRLLARFLFTELVGLHAARATKQDEAMAKFLKQVDEDVFGEEKKWGSS